MESLPKIKNRGSNALFDAKLRTMLLTISAILCSCTLTPFFILFVIFFMAFRLVIHIILRLQYRGRFKGFLKGTDCIWAIEETPALSVINVVGFLAQNSTNKYATSEYLEKYRKLVKSRLAKSPYEKLFYLRRRKYGYYFWEKSDCLYLQDQVKWLNIDHSRCLGTCGDVNSDYLRGVLSRLSNTPLPHNHQLSWEILVGSTCRRAYFHHTKNIKNGIYRDQDTVEIPIVFRIHHSMGDGVALLKVLVEALADEKSTKRFHNERIAARGWTYEKLRLKLNEINTPVPQETVTDLRKPIANVEIAALRHDVLSASMPVTYTFILQFLLRPMLRYVKSSLYALEKVTETDIVQNLKWVELRRKCFIRFIKELWELIQQTARQFWFLVSVIFLTPPCLIHQAVRSMDRNHLHGPALSGEKIITCWFENYFKDTQEEKLLTKIRSIKDVTGAKFSDVVLTALSYALQKHYIRVEKPVPKSISVILPIRMEPFTSEQSILQNKFSVGVMSLPIANEDYERRKGKSTLFDRLQQISQYSKQLKYKPDIYINYWTMKYVCPFLPEALLRILLESRSTFLFSNLPGPHMIDISGQKLKNVAFWLPHRNTTGIACALLSYGGNVQMSLIVDRILIHKEYQVTYILEDTVTAIDNMYDILTLSCFSKKLRQ